MQYAKLFAAAPELLNSIKQALSISDIWMPSDENVSEEFMDKMQAIATMYHKFKEVVSLATE